MLAKNFISEREQLKSLKNEGMKLEKVTMF